jgi:hypothetical protein
MYMLNTSGSVSLMILNVYLISDHIVGKISTCYCPSEGSDFNRRFSFLWTLHTRTCGCTNAKLLERNSVLHLHLEKKAISY